MNEDELRKEFESSGLPIAIARCNALGDDLGAYKDVGTNMAWRTLQLLRSKPIDMVLFCPKCCTQHIDMPEPQPEPGEWTNPPHRSHLCSHCGHIWRPADVPTNGVLFVQTKGKDDAPLHSPLEYVHNVARMAHEWGVDIARPRAPDGWPSSNMPDKLEPEYLEPLLANARAMAGESS